MTFLWPLLSNECQRLAKSERANQAKQFQTKGSGTAATALLAIVNFQTKYSSLLIVPENMPNVLSRHAILKQMAQHSLGTSNKSTHLYLKSLAQ